MRKRIACRAPLSSNSNRGFPCPLKAKSISLFSFVSCLGATLLAVSFIGINRTNERGSGQLLASLIDGQKEKLQAHTMAMSHAVATAVDGIDDPQQQIGKIRDFIADYRFEDDDSGYFFVYRDHEVAVLPPNPALEGEDLGDTADENGVYFVRELHRVSRAGGGFVSYVFAKPGAGLQPKIAYANSFPERNFGSARASISIICKNSKRLLWPRQKSRLLPLSASAWGRR